MDRPLVLVTGASGYVGSWCVAALLVAGYRVRGTVRDLKDQAKISFLRNLCPGAQGGPLELIEADLLDPLCWPAAVTGCTFVLHVASPFVLEEPQNEDVLIKPAVEVLPQHQNLSYLHFFYSIPLTLSYLVLSLSLHSFSS